jgi:hypothetical protein
MPIYTRLERVVAVHGNLLFLGVMLFGILIRLSSNGFKKSFHKPGLSKSGDIFMYQTHGEPEDSEDEALHNEHSYHFT